MEYELCIYPISKELVICFSTPWDQTQIFGQLYSEGYSLELNHVFSCWGKGSSWRKPTYGCGIWIPNSLSARRPYQTLKIWYFHQTGISNAIIRQYKVSTFNRPWFKYSRPPNVWIIWSDACRGQDVLRGGNEPLLHCWFDLSCSLDTLKTHHCYFWFLHCREWWKGDFTGRKLHEIIPEAKPSRNNNTAVINENAPLARGELRQHGPVSRIA